MLFRCACFCRGLCCVCYLNSYIFERFLCFWTTLRIHNACSSSFDARNHLLREEQLWKWWQWNCMLNKWDIFRGMNKFWTDVQYNFGNDTGICITGMQFFYHYIMLLLSLKQFIYGCSNSEVLLFQIGKNSTIFMKIIFLRWTTGQNKCKTRKILLV